jgi:hypothetical protein
MDLGLYRHRRIRFWLAIVVPLSLLCMVYAVLFCRHRALSAALADVEGLSALVPRVQAAHDRAAARLADFTPDARESGEIAETLRRELTAGAYATGMTLASIAVEDRADTADGLALRRVEWQGSGTLQAIARCVAGLQTPGRPVLIDSFTLGMARMTNEPVYEVQAGMRIAVRGPDVRNEGGEHDHVEN